jgi:hypothetical protein
MKDFPAAYQVSEGSALSVDRPFYERIAPIAARGDRAGSRC